VHSVSKKNYAKLFCQNFVKFPTTAKIFGTKMAKRINLCELHLFSTSPSLCQRTTVLIEDNANLRYITL